MPPLADQRLRRLDCRFARLAQVGMAILAPAVSCLLALPGPVAAAERTGGDREAFFEAHVRPLLVAKCQECHGGKVAEAGLRLDSRRGVLAGSDSGPVVVPGDATKSRLIAAVKHADDLAMPPDEKLSAVEVETLEAWVADGLPWSGAGGDDGGEPPAADRSRDMAARLADSLQSHWAFRPPRRHVPPDLPAALDPALAAAWSESPIDRFIATPIVAAGLSPSPEAEPRDLVRRLWFDLTGLPPPAAEVEAFCDDPSDARYRELVERLLASPAHAEHWARKWLDLARYADTMGYALDGQDSRYPFAWTYRDWVVGALEADVPYDRFLMLQIAADRIDPPVPPSDLAALGFLTCGRTFVGNVHDLVDDRIDLVTRGLMGLTVSCARCHDHKYEPVTAADYYALHGIFTSCSLPEELPLIGAAPAGPAADAFAKTMRELQAAVDRHDAAVHARATRDAVSHAADYFMETARPLPRGPDKRPPRLADGYEMEHLLIDRLARRLDKCDPSDPILGLWVAVSHKADAEITAAINEVIGSWPKPDPRPEGAQDARATVNDLLRGEVDSARPRTLRDLAEVYARLALRVAPEKAGGPPIQADDPPAVLALRAAIGVEGTPLVVLATESGRVANREENTARRKLLREITRHEIDAPGGPPRAMVLEDQQPPHDSRVLLRGDPNRPGELVPRRMPLLLGGASADRTASGRLDLARTIAGPDNPLTPRVIVNWAWAHHMGRPLVETPGDFGLRGEPPSHPELLDDLARRFVEEGRWSLRWLHRQIVESRTWRQSAAIRAELATRDPDNRLHARANRRRLDWEAWRDSLLVAAGTLEVDRRGGPGVPLLASDSMNRRSLYAQLDRQNVPGIMRVFDVANPDAAVHLRPRTSVPQQSLAALNAPLVVEAAKRLAARVEREAGPDGDDAACVERMWRAAFSRSPTAEEHETAVAWLAAEARADAGRPAFGSRARLAQALLATAEFQFVD